MTEEAQQDNKDVRQESLLHKAWVSLAMALGVPLTVALAVLVGVTIVLLAAGLTVGLIWYLSPILDAKTNLSITDRKDLVQGLASVAQAAAVGLTGVAGFIGLAFTWRNIRQTRESTQDQLQQAREAQQQTYESTKRTLELTEQGQITERFTRAIDQLGATDDKGEYKLEIRLGGIYGLERIDKESPERAYHGTVMEILTAYVRENSRWVSEEASPQMSAAKAAAKLDRGRFPYAKLDREVGKQAARTLRRLPIDIRAILDVLKRREEEHVPEEHRVSLDLRGAFLQEASLQGADLQGADLQGADLQSADLNGADLQGANLRVANLRESNLRGANLRGANLQGANLQEAYLYRANLRGAYLQEASLRRADFNRADLERADLRVADLHEANLEYANLYTASVGEADLDGANLQGADLRVASLDGASLQGADLEYANLEYANLIEANLTGTKNLTFEQIEWVVGDEEAKLPEYLVDHRPQRWSMHPSAQQLIIEEHLEQDATDQ
jgi:uncharacterized protein YjbI with pentapeptide repeats